ncbi:lymphocyte cytosolic protein 2 isoform X4 [Brachyhypopomus gauderio]|uniref:lymphocyte cytosolic protein 2 isoform X4 n=1 Tax=Brachyhypopomus gauderio TaxID=698409 RepID=UPI004042C740
MNLDGTPSRAEVTDWSCQTLADYLKKMRLSGCDTLVKRSGINGSKFLAMSDTDIQRFPKVHVPLIIKIRNEINQAEKKKGLFHRPKSTPHPKQGFVPTPETWPTDEFDDEDSEPDYEEPDDPNETFEDNYICAEEVYHETVESDDEYELPPSEISTEIPRHCHTARPVGDGVYIGRIRDVPAKSQTPKPPQRPDSTQSYPSKSQASSLAAKSPKPDSPRRPVPSSCKSKPVSGPRIDRRTKPHSAAQKDTANLQMASGLPNFPTSRSTQLVSNDQDMDPEWYVRSMTRGEAENYLRQINKNGAFLVRDSSKNATDQPYTLMVLNQHKVYNIQIRYHGNNDGYSLGTGMKGTEIFPSVRDIVSHHINTPLMLIDAMDRESGAQHQCCLVYPVRL